MTEMKAEITKVNITLTEMETKIENSNKAVEEKAKLLKDHADIQSGIQNLGDIHNKYCEKLQGLSKQVEKESILKDYNDEFKKAFDKALQKAEELEKSINDLTKNFMGDNSILQKINEFKDYLATLSSTDICLVINISSSIFILTCLVSIIFAVYGNFLIERLSLEEKYPKLAIFMRLRVKLQHTYIISNTLFIVIALILMIIVNFITLMKL
jgi:hypothetical protein